MHHVASGVCLLSLQLLVGRRRQASLAEREEHLRRLVHRHDHGVVVVACSQSLTDLLNVVQTLLGAAPRRACHGCVIHAGLLLLLRRLLMNNNNRGQSRMQGKKF